MVIAAIDFFGSDLTFQNITVNVKTDSGQTSVTYTPAPTVGSSELAIGAIECVERTNAGNDCGTTIAWRSEANGGVDDDRANKVGVTGAVVELAPRERCKSEGLMGECSSDNGESADRTDDGLDAANEGAVETHVASMAFSRPASGMHLQGNGACLAPQSQYAGPRPRKATLWPCSPC